MGRLVSWEHMRGVELEQRYQMSEDIDLWFSPSTKIKYTTILYYLNILEFLMRQSVDHFFLFFIVGYLVRLPRAFHLTQDLVKIVGSSDHPGINK